MPQDSVGPFHVPLIRTICAVWNSGHCGPVMRLLLLLNMHLFLRGFSVWSPFVFNYCIIMLGSYVMSYCSLFLWF